MGNPVRTTPSTAPTCYPGSDPSDGTATVQFGETTLSQVANRLHTSADDLLMANPQIKDPYHLSAGQEITVPANQSTAPQAPQTGNGNSQKTTIAAPPQPRADSLEANSMKSKLDDAKTDYARKVFERENLPPDEKMMLGLRGEQGLAEYQQQKREVRDEYTQARRAYETTGKVPPDLKHWAPIEIKRGEPMSRAERYDVMTKNQGKDHQELGDIQDDNRDPDYMTKDEFKEEFWAREKKEYNQCDDDYTRPGKIDACQRAVDEKYGGPGFKDWRDQQESAVAAQWRETQGKIDGVVNSGPAGLAGRVVGRSIGYAFGGDKGADFGEELGGAIGGLGDGLAATYNDKAQMDTTTRGDYGDRTVDSHYTGEAPVKQESEKPDAPGASVSSPTGPSSAPAVKNTGEAQAGQVTGAKGGGAGAAPAGPEYAKTLRQDEAARTASHEELADTMRHDAVAKTARPEELAKTENAGAGAKPNPSPKSGGGTGVSEGDAKLQKDARDEAQRVANYKLPTFQAKPGDGKVVSPAAALDGLEKGTMKVVDSASHSFHKDVWNNVIGQKGEPPVAYTVNDTVRIDVDRLTPEQLNRYRAYVQAQDRAKGGN
jgi:hypothetical protein